MVPAPGTAARALSSASGRTDGGCAGISAQEISFAREGSWVLLPARLSGHCAAFSSLSGAAR